MIKLSTARNMMVFMTDSTDHITGKTGLTLTLTASKAGAAFASITPTVTDLGVGWYSLALDTTMTNTLGDLAIHITATGADPTDVRENVFTDLPGASVSNVTGNVGGNVVGSVASVTGSVASVTGNVGGNVTGSVGSVLGNVAGSVASVVGNVGGSVASVAGNVAGSVASVVGNVGGNIVGTVASVVGAVGSVTGAVGSVTAAVTITAGSVQAVWDALTSALTTTGSIGKLIVTNLDALISSRAAASTAVSNVDYTTARAVKLDNLDATISSRLASGTYVAPPSAATIAQAVWDVLTSAISTVGSIGLLLKTNIDAAISTRLPTSSYSAAPSAATVASAVWNEPLAGHTTAGTTGPALTAAGSAGDPWVTLLPGSYTTGQAGNILGNRLDAAVSSRLATVGYTAPDNTSISAIKAKTDNLPAAPAAVSDVQSVGTQVGLVKAKTDNLPASPAAVSDVTTVGTAVATVGTNVLAVKSKTDLIPASPASSSDVSTVGTAVAAVSTKLGTPAGVSVSADIATANTGIGAVKAKTDQLTYVSGNVLANAQVVGDKTGYFLADGQLTVKKNHVLPGFTFEMSDALTHVPLTGLTVLTQISLDGGALQNSTNAATEVGQGMYTINFAAADMNATTIGVRFSAAGADTRMVTIITQA